MNARLTCHRCGSSRLLMTEFHVESHLWADGLYLIDGEIQPAGEKWSRPAEILTERTCIRCEACGHSWHPRRRVGMPYEPPKEQS